MTTEPLVNYAASPAPCGQLYAALAKAQAAFVRVQPRRENVHLRTRYADLADVWDMIRPHLAAAELAVLQWVATTSETVTVTTILGHASGQSIASAVTLPVIEQKGTSRAQQIGSALTYARRYGLCALVGVTVAEEDDDGTAAGGQAADVKAETAASAARAANFVVQIGGLCTVSELGQWWEAHKEEAGKLTPWDLAAVRQAVTDHTKTVRAREPQAETAPGSAAGKLGATKPLSLTLDGGKA